MRSVEENKQSVLKLYSLLQQKPYPHSQILPLLAPTITSKRIEDPVFSGSREDFSQFFGKLMTEMFPEAKFTNRRIVGEGNQVWIWALVEGLGPTRESVDM